MRTPYLAIVGSALALSCSAPEDSNPAVRCDATMSCPDELVCYRGFCIEGHEDEVLPASSIAPADARAPVAKDASSTASDAGAAHVDAAEVIIQDAPGGRIVAVDAAAPVPVATPEPIIVTPPPPMPAPSAPVTAPVSTSIACVADCALGADGKACKECFRSVFGDQPSKICEKTASLSAELAALCSSLCLTTKGHGSTSCSQAALSCRGAGCGGP
ncbi:MAG: hypothetical protein JWN04_6138 [Myxococcaceae bacterium]|nr:hypothetical protein [Myxococcaceae bacterium]